MRRQAWRDAHAQQLPCCCLGTSPAVRRANTVYTTTTTPKAAPAGPSSAGELLPLAPSTLAACSHHGQRGLGHNGVDQAVLHRLLQQHSAPQRESISPRSTCQACTGTAMHAFMGHLQRPAQPSTDTAAHRHCPNWTAEGCGWVLQQCRLDPALKEPSAHSRTHDCMVPSPPTLPASHSRGSTPAPVRQDSPPTAAAPARSLLQDSPPPFGGQGAPQALGSKCRTCALMKKSRSVSMVICSMDCPVNSAR